MLLTFTLQIIFSSSLPPVHLCITSLPIAPNTVPSSLFYYNTISQESQTRSPSTIIPSSKILSCFPCTHVSHSAFSSEPWSLPCSLPDSNTDFSFHHLEIIPFSSTRGRKLLAVQYCLFLLQLISACAGHSSITLNSSISFLYHSFSQLAHQYLSHITLS